jgi:hypothetical protein
VAVSNTAVNDGYSENLGVSVSSATGGARTLNVTQAIAPGVTDSSDLLVLLDGSTAGTRSGSVTFDFTTKGAGTSGLADALVSSQSISVTGAFYDHAQVSGSVGSVGRVTQGASVTKAMTLSNVVSSALYDNATVTGISNSLGCTTSFSAPIDITAGGSDQSVNVTFVAGATTGNVSTNLTISYRDQNSYAGWKSATSLAAVSATVDPLAEHIATSRSSQLGRGSLGSVTVTKISAEGYVAGYLDRILGGTGVSKGTVGVILNPTGSLFSPDVSVVLFDFAGVDATSDQSILASIRSDLQSFGYTFRDRWGNGNYLIPSGKIDPLAGFTTASRNYDLELVMTPTETSNRTFFGFDFGKYTPVTGNVVNIAVVPEPGAWTGVAGMGVVGLRRRRRRA